MTGPSIKSIFQIGIKIYRRNREKLETIFDRAEGKGWILFFGEADALFGKRTGVRGCDKHSSQEVSHLLQRMEDYNGPVILATNMKSNIDSAFARRFNSIIHFSFPEAIKLPIDNPTK